jgi:hypothetical protein
MDTNPNHFIFLFSFINYNDFVLFFINLHITQTIKTTTYGQQVFILLLFLLFEYFLCIYVRPLSFLFEKLY